MNLVVMGIKKAPRISRILGGGIVRSVIENCSLPLLLVPEGCLFHKFNKMAFASEYNVKDVNLIAILTEMMAPYDAEILIMHSKNPNKLIKIALMIF